MSHTFYYLQWIFAKTRILKKESKFKFWRRACEQLSHVNFSWICIRKFQIQWCHVEVHGRRCRIKRSYIHVGIEFCKIDIWRNFVNFINKILKGLYFPCTIFIINSPRISWRKQPFSIVPPCLNRLGIYVYIFKCTF